MKTKRTLKQMTEAQKTVYYVELKKALANGVDKWTAIKFARSMATIS
jgi:hypothetical protein